MAQHTVDLPCIADTYCDADNPGTNYGSATTLYMGGEHRYYALLKFDWTALLRKNVTDVKLRVYSARAVTGHGETKIVWVVPSKGFNESTETYSTYGEVLGKFDRLEVQSIPANTWVEITGLADIYNLAQYRQKFIDYGLALQYSDWPAYDYWQIQSREGANPPILRVTYDDVPPNAPTPTEPIGLYKDNKSIIRFAWQYNSDVGGEQKAFDLQWSTDQSTWTTVSETTENNYYDMPADTLPAGNVYWRVRCYNEYDEVGPYCDIQSFYAIGAPAAPVLNAIPANTARPVVSWSAFSQQVYQLQVLSGDTIVYDSGIVPGINIRQHKIKAWLADGEYTVRLRIKNEYDLWSEWGSAVVTISTDKPEKPSIALQRSAYGVEITGTGLVYRSDYDKDDYICIGTASGVYHDNTVASGKEYKYFVRAVSANETYNDSDIKFIQAELRHALIAPVSDLANVFVFTRSLNGPPKRTLNHNPGGAFAEYAGRTRPVWEPTEHVSAGWTMAFYLKSWAEVEAFIVLVDRKETVLYRDAKGRKIYGVLGNLSVSDERSGYTVGFTLTEVDYIEGVDV
jgi:hypothetical protein